MITLLRIFFRAEGTRPGLVLACLLASGVLASLSWASSMPLLSLATPGDLEGDSTVATRFVQQALDSVGLDREAEADVCTKVSSRASDSAVLVVTHRDTWDVLANRRYDLAASRVEVLDDAVGA